MLDSTLIWMMNRIKGCQGASTPPLASRSLELQLQLCKALPVSHAELHHSPACSKELLISSDGFECGKPNDINLYTIRGWSSHGNIGNIGFTTLSLSIYHVKFFRGWEQTHRWFLCSAFRRCCICGCSTWNSPLQSPTCWCWARTSKTRNVISISLGSCMSVHNVAALDLQ